MSPVVDPLGCFPSLHLKPVKWGLTHQTTGHDVLSCLVSFVIKSSASKSSTPKTLKICLRRQNPPQQSAARQPRVETVEEWVEPVPGVQR